MSNIYTMTRSLSDAHQELFDLEVENGKLRGLIDNLAEAVRLPADYPCRAEYMNMLLAKADLMAARADGRRAA